MSAIHDTSSLFSGWTSRIPKSDADSATPAYATTTPGKGYNPRNWSLRKRILVGAGTGVIIILAIILGAVYGTRATRRPYPEYSTLDYKLVDKYTPSTFLDRFDYFSDEDPTDGFVKYVNRSTATALNLTYTTPGNDSVILRVDTSDPDAAYGRASVRLESKTSYDTGLFIFDIIHTPYGCGTWPALWLTDPYNWPVNGEIDLLETTNRGNDGNAVTLHTGGKCEMNGVRKQNGTEVHTQCDDSLDGNAGCGVEGDEFTYGPAMNAGGGGVYALEIRSDGIRAWYFPRASIPSDIDITHKSNISPDPSTWPTPLADFPNTSCDITALFKNQSIIANIDLCGQLGAQEQLYKGLYDCPATCEDFVAHNPGNFTEAYWEFGGFWVWQV